MGNKFGVGFADEYKTDKNCCGFAAFVPYYAQGSEKMFANSKCFTNNKNVRFYVFAKVYSCEHSKEKGAGTMPAPVFIMNVIKKLLLPIRLLKQWKLLKQSQRLIYNDV